MHLLFETQSKTNGSKKAAYLLSKKLCHNINRIIVVLLTFASITQSGMIADIMMMAAVVMWLWLPECDIYLGKSPRLQWLVIISIPVLFYFLSYIAHK